MDFEPHTACGEARLKCTLYSLGSWRHIAANSRGGHTNLVQNAFASAIGPGNPE